MCTSRSPSEGRTPSGTACSFQGSANKLPRKASTVPSEIQGAEEGSASDGFEKSRTAFLRAGRSGVWSEVAYSTLTWLHYKLQHTSACSECSLTAGVSLHQAPVPHTGRARVALPRGRAATHRFLPMEQPRRKVCARKTARPRQRSKNATGRMTAARSPTYHRPKKRWQLASETGGKNARGW